MAAGGAFWARGNEIKFSDAFALAGAEQSTDAEILASCEAILRIAQHPELGKELERGPKTRLVLVIDCEAVEQVLGQGKSVRMSKVTKAKVAQVKALKQRLNFWLKVNHVKAHSGVATPRQWVNQWCDTHSREHMRKMRETSPSARLCK